MTEDILQEILVQDSNGELFYRFANADGKVWIMPASHLRTAMELYQPSSWKGRLLKRWFPLLSKMRGAREAVGAVGIRCRVNEELNRRLECALQTDGLQYSIFCGTPCVHQKTTMQISRGNKILGYCKLTENDEIAALFEKEARLLETLHEKGFHDLPKCLLLERLNDGTTLFLQSTRKTLASEVTHEWSGLHDDFLKRLGQATLQHLKFEESDYFRTLQALAENREWLPIEVDSAVLRRALEEVCHRWQGRKVAFSAYHADFTPWNMFVADGRLFVFDWEYARLTYPPMLDRYHFFTQTAIFKHHWKAEDIRQYMGSAEGRWMDAEDYKAYLVEVIARFTVREQGHAKGDMLAAMKLWSQLLSFMTPHRKQ